MTNRREFIMTSGLGAGVMALATGGLYAIAWSQKSQYMDVDNPDIQTREDLHALHDRNRRALLGAAGTGAIAAGLGVGALITWRF